MQRFITLLSIYIFLFLLCILFIRTIIFAGRIFSEVTAPAVNTEQEFLFAPSINPCTDREKDRGGEELIIYNYRSLGVSCEK